MNATWKLSEFNGNTGNLYYDLMTPDGKRETSAWIVEYTLAGQGRVFQFVQTIDWNTVEQRHPMRKTFDEAKADAAMFFAKRELERHE